MNSDESDYDFNEKRKRTNCQTLLDSTASSSTSSSPIVGTSKRVCSRRRKVATAVIEETESSSDAEDEVSHKSKVKKSTQEIQKWLSGSNAGASREGSHSKMEQADSHLSSGDESIVVPINMGRCHRLDSSPTDTSLRSTFSSPILARRGRRYTNLILDSTEESSSNESCDSSPIVSRRISTVTRLDSETDEDSDNLCFSRKTSNSVRSVLAEKDVDTDSSDDTSEKCPICLVSFKMKQVGIPENCEHCFCLECIQEWSKNMNTCPVDRKEYLSILVKDCYAGSLVRTISVEKPQGNSDPIFINLDDVVCEICASNEHEDRLLLCDGCDLAFHLYCLTPQLDEIPSGEWYCNVCADVRSEEASLIQTRIIPRTRQSERVRRSVENNRRNRTRSERVDVENTPSASTASRSNRISSTSTRKTKKKTSRGSANRYKIVYELNESGEAVPVKRKVGSRRRKTKRSKKRRSAPQRIIEKSIKKRLAAQLGMCVPRGDVPQAIPDMRISACDTGLRRNQTGMPSLDLFGTVNRLDYFDQSDDEQDMFRESESRGVHTMLARRNTTSTSDILRRRARRKAVAVSIPTVSSSTDILDSIMDSQAKLLSKNSVFSVVDSSGKLQIEDKKKDSLLNNNKPDKPDFNTYTVRETPWHGRNGNYRPQNRGGYYNRGWHNNYNRQQGRYGGNYSQANTSNNNSSNNYIPPQDQYYNDAPQDYTQRTLCEAEMLQENEENKDKNTPQSDQDVDVYGDIENETVSTSRIEDDDFKPASPPVEAPNNDDDDDDSESGMIIDTDRAPDEAVTSTNCEQVYSPGNPTASPCQPSYSPTNPTGSPDVPTENPESIAEGISELQKELASGFDELKRGFEEFQNEMNQSMSIGAVEPNQVDSLADQTCISGLEADGTLNTTDHPEKVPDDDEVSNDGCPNFSIYSRETKSVVLTLSSTMSQPSEAESCEVELTQPVTAPIISQQPASEPYDFYHTQPSVEPIPVDQITDESSSLPETQQVTVEKTGSDPRLQKQQSNWNLGALYSDSEDESVVKKSGTFGLSDIKDMTEDILSEEERSYTPVLDEKNNENSKEGLEGLDTELISDDDKNDFDESHELKTVTDGDALEINAKESEMEFTRPEEFEDGEISDKKKDALTNDAETIDTTGNIGGTPPPTNRRVDVEDDKRSDKEIKKKKKDKNKSKDDASADKENVDKESFKKLSKGTKERNYRDKDKSKNTRHKSRSKTPEETEKEKETRKRKEKRKELERYNVRALIAEKPRPPPKDQFGRDLPSRSRSRSYTPPLPQTSPIRQRVSPSPIRAPTPIRRKSRSRSVSRANTPPRSRRSESKRRSKTRDKSSKRRERSRSRSVGRKRDRSKVKKRKRSTSKSTKRRRSKEKNKKNRTSRSRRRSRTTRSRSPAERRNRRDWTPSLSRSPSPPLHRMSPSWTPPRRETPHRNQNLTVILNNGAAKKKKDKRGKRRRADEPSSKRRRRDRDRTPPPSKEVFASGDNILVSVSFNNENETRDVSTRDSRKRKEAADQHSQKKNRERRNKNRKDLSGIKPVAIIDLDRSPFQEIAVSPKDVIVLSDSDNNETENRNLQNPDSSQQVASPEITPNYSMGPKTPPEPSVKFSLVSKPAQVRTINNPLHDPMETIEEDINEEENNLHKGPNTPPEEPPTSPPSSPDVYDPFEPTKSPSVSPEPRNPDNNDQNKENVDSIDLGKSGETPDALKSLTPPMPDIQPADSQSSIQEISDSKSPDIGAGTLSQTANSKPVGQTMPFSAVQTSNTATSVSSTNSASRINILSSTMINPTIPQRIVLPNQIKSSPVKIPPTTKAAVKSTPIKPLQLKKTVKPTNGNGLDEINLDFDSPYSPGSSDYEDLFEPPIEPPSAIIKSKKQKRGSQKKPAQNLTTFDNLFGSPSYQKKMNKRMTMKKAIAMPNKTKHVGVKIDEESLKILEDLPNSAVEMQVKDKFLKKLNRQERVVEEVKLVLKPYYNKKKITKEEYKDIMRRAVPKICHNKTGEINPFKIRHLVEAYVKKLKQSKKVTSSSSLPQKVVV